MHKKLFRVNAPDKRFPTQTAVDGGRIRGEGEMATRIRAKDWSETPLGPIRSWSETLVCCVNVMLASPETFALFWGADQTLLYNDEYSQLLHEKHPSALGRPGVEVWAEVWHIIEPQIRAAFKDAVTIRVSEACIPILADGKLRDGWFTYGFYPIYDNGRIVAVGNSGREITAMVQTRDGLRQTREKLQLAMEFARQGAFFFDASTGLITVDSVTQSLFEMPEPAGPAEYWISKVHPDDQDYVRESFAAASTGERLYDLEHRIVRSDGVRWIQARAKLISEPGSPVVLTGICEDTTERKAQREALQRNDKLAAVGRLASSISHEINNPLESVTNLLYLIGSSSDLQAVRKYTETAERELRRVSIITSQTLRFHRQSTNPSPFYCQDLIGDSLSIFQGRLVNSDIQVEKRKRAQQAVTCLGGEIRQVLSNLIGNAIDAMPSGGRLILRSREATDWTTGEKGLVLTVADTGSGMDAATRKRLCEPFFTTKGIGGTGLGLWISDEIVKRHQGRLRVRSSQASQHKGTVFSLFLPFASVQTQIDSSL